MRFPVPFALITLFGMLWMSVASSFAAETYVDPKDYQVFKTFIEQAGHSIDEYEFTTEYEVLGLDDGYLMIKMPHRKKESNISRLDGRVMVDDKGRILAVDINGGEVNSLRSLESLTELISISVDDTNMASLSLQNWKN